MTTYYVTCHTPDNADLDRRIQGLGGSFGWLAIDQIINLIKNGAIFFTAPPLAVNRRIIVAQHPRTYRLYLKTDADGVEPNNILALPRCL
ncbi:DUF3892 domain-containing protein [Qipengyuania sp. GH1]|uniref:DUF3892 domain-containing protein n=1 Tax=Qipengyuania aestuarii TaxID=2867241 RepID=UPI001C871A0F|nr:DUF3892 domain-containing protein [Qipengyuania aestuarii]MBX7536410.1 DUF3892 domain-containing protein [Qipengyuania aestuarii]